VERPAAAQQTLGGFDETLKLDARSLNHLLQVDDELGIHGILGSSEDVQRRRAGRVEDPEHAQWLKSVFVDSSVYLLRGRQNLRSGGGLIQADRDIRSFAFLFHHNVVLGAINN
jgi:hypothetical protein